MKRLFTLIITACLFTSSGYALIQEVQSMEEANLFFESATPNTLAIFDVDMVLTQPKEPAFHMSNYIRHHAIFKSIMNDLTPQQQDLFFNLIVICGDSILVEENAPTFIQNLKKRGIKTIALTGIRSIHASERFNVLKNFGINFSSSYPNHEKIVFNTLNQYLGGHPTYFKGILFSNGVSGPTNKRDTLKAFFKCIKKLPDQIVFLDDREHNLHTVEKALNEIDPSIEFIGLHYTGSTHYPSKQVSEKELASLFERVKIAAIKESEAFN